MGGTWRDSKLRGFGVYSWRDGRQCVGQYVRDKKEGFGIFTWPDGRRYEGYWLEGTQHGSGNCTSAAGIWRSTFWEAGHIRQRDFITDMAISKFCTEAGTCESGNLSPGMRKEMQTFCKNIQLDFT